MPDQLMTFNSPGEAVNVPLHMAEKFKQEKKKKQMRKIEQMLADLETEDEKPEPAVLRLEDDDISDDVDSELEQYSDNDENE